MKRVICFLLLAVLVPSISSWAEECALKSSFEKKKAQFDAYRPAPGAVAAPVGNQRAAQGNASVTTGNAVNAAKVCSDTLDGFSKDFKKLADDMESEENKEKCKKEKKKADKAKAAADAKKAECDAAGDAAKKQEDKQKENEKKGGEGKMPEMKPPEDKKKDEKKEDPTAKEKARQAKIKACKDNVQKNLEIKKKNCEAQFPFDPKVPVYDMKQKQDECKQNEIFGSQKETAQCDAANPPDALGLGIPATQ